MTASAHIPSLIKPREAMRRRVAGQEVIFRIASGSEIIFFLRTYSAMTRGKFPYPRGWPLPTVFGSITCGDADASLPKLTHGNLIAVSMSDSLIRKYRAPDLLPLSRTRSNAASAGSLFHSLAICATLLFSNRLFSAFAIETTMTLSQPPEASTMFHQPGDSVFISFFKRVRVAGSFNLSKSFSFPPSDAHAGITAESDVPPAV